MGATLDLYIDASTGSLVEGGSVVGGALPTLTRNDSYTLRLRLLEKQTNGLFEDIDLTSASLKAGIGTIEDEPSAGSFKLAINGITSSAIPFNATAVCVYNAISNNVSTVALYGTESYGSYLLTATQPNTAMSFSPDAFTLFPTSSVLINTRRNPVTSVEAQQVVKLVRNPIVYADTFITSPTAGEIALPLLNNGTSALNETYELNVGPRVLGGSFALVFGSNATTAIPLFSTAASVQAAISVGISAVSRSVSVQDNGKSGYIISFVGSLGLTNITTDLTLDPSGVQFIPFKQTTLTINTAEVEDAFADSGEDTITPTLEIELTQDGAPKTVFQGSVTIRKDLITAGSTVPGARDSYYTKAETDALFVEDSASNVDATNRVLYDVFATGSYDYGNRALLDNSGFSAVIDHTTGLAHQSNLLGFYSTPITAQPANTNVVSALVNVGLIASSVTLGNVVSNSTVNVDATNAKLAAGGQTSINYGSRTLNNSSGTQVVSYGAGLAFANTPLGFYGTTVTAQPANINVVSGLINVGLIATGTTYGVLPQSPRTLTTVTFFGPVTVGGNDVNSTTVSVVGVLPNDVCLLGLPAQITEGITFFSHCVTAGQVHVDMLNVTGTQKIQTAATYRITVIGY